MADGTRIEWTDATWNPITGCSVVSPGCTNCYAMKLAGTRLKHHPSRKGLTTLTKAGPVWNGKLRFNEGWLDQPLRWREPRMIFVCAHGDLFHEAAPDEWIDRVFAVMAMSTQHTFQVLTKRPERMQEYLEAGPIRREAIIGQMHMLGAHFAAIPWPLPNVWLGVSVERQQEADERVPILLGTPAVVRWISAEPLLGPVDLTTIDVSGDREIAPLGWNHLGRLAEGEPEGPRLDWVVVGGESGKDARPMHPDWARSLRDQCSAAGVPFFMKQLSGPGGRAIKEIDRFPIDLRIREWPHADS
jgi:protein gp37